MKRKRIFGAAVATVMVLGTLAGCGETDKTNNSGETSENQSGSEEQYTITLWDINSAETDAKYQDREKALQEMAELYPNVKVETSYFQDAQYREKIPVAAAANELPDVFFNWIGSTTDSLVNAGNVLNLTPYEEELVPLWEDSIINDCYSGEELYFIPSSIQTYLLYCNVDLLDEYGLDVPETYDDILNIIDVLKDTNITPFTGGGKDFFPISILQQTFHLRLSGSEIMLSQLAGEETFDTADTNKSAELLAEIAEGYPENTLGIDSNEAFAQFTMGKAAMYYGGNWNSGMLEAAELPFEVKVTGFPAIDGEKYPNAMLGGACDVYMINADTENPDLVVEWTTEFMKRFMKNQAENSGSISGWKIEDLDEGKIGDIVKQQNEVYAQCGDSIRNWDIIMPFDKAENLYNKILEVFAGQSDPDSFGADFEKIVRE